MTIPESIKIIDFETIKGCSLLMSTLIISASVEQIKSDAFNDTKFSEVYFLWSNLIECSNSIGLPPKTIVHVNKDFRQDNFCSFEIVLIDKKNKKNLGTGEIVCIVVGILIIVVATVIFFFFFVFFIRKRNQNILMRIHETSICFFIKQVFVGAFLKNPKN